jgi:hypothetical protein
MATPSVDAQVGVIADEQAVESLAGIIYATAVLTTTPATSSSKPRSGGPKAISAAAFQQSQH